MHDRDLAAHFAPLFAALETVVSAKDYNNPAVDEQIAAGAAAARAAGVRPETVIAYLRRHLHEVALSAVGDWYRGVLVERFVALAITAYFRTSDDGGPVATRLTQWMPESNERPADEWPPVVYGPFDRVIDEIVAAGSCEELEQHAVAARAEFGAHPQWEELERVLNAKRRVLGGAKGVVRDGG